jgi:hypothetical protein
MPFMKYTYSDELFSDLHKDAYNFRPREHIYYTSTPEEKQVIWDQAVYQLTESERDRIAGEKVAVLGFEERIAILIGLGASDRTAAIRWIFEGVDHSDPDYLCYTLGLPYGYLDKEEL